MKSAARDGDKDGPDQGVSDSAATVLMVATVGQPADTPGATRRGWLSLAV
jgi:hypothetical protein